MTTPNVSSRSALSGSSKRRRASALVVRLSAEEKLLATERATAVGLTLSSYGRARILGGPAPRARRAAPPIDLELLAQLLAQLRKVGSNLNQVARALNSGHVTARGDVRSAVYDVREAVQEVLKAMRR